MSFNYKEFPKRLPETDFWGQVARTVNGKAVDETQIQMIVRQIQTGLDLNEKDIVLDLACGNGALSARVSSFVKTLHGVDNSEYLIYIAKKYFEKQPDVLFSMGDVLEYVSKAYSARIFNKMLCYGSFSYFSNAMAKALFEKISIEYPNIQTMFLGNLPDKDSLHFFPGFSKISQDDISSPDTQIGVWRTKDEIRALAKSAGWSAEFLSMPVDFYSQLYRYDVVLRRQANNE